MRNLLLEISKIVAENTSITWTLRLCPGENTPSQFFKFNKHLYTADTETGESTYAQ